MQIYQVFRNIFKQLGMPHWLNSHGHHSAPPPLYCDREQSFATVLCGPNLIMAGAVLGTQIQSYETYTESSTEVTVGHF